MRSSPEDDMRAAIYVRVSTADQNTDLQIRDLQEYASRQGWEIIDTYQDVISGAKASRPGLNLAMEDAAARKFDCLLVWRLDRFRRSLVDCLNNIQELERQRIRFIAVTQNLDTDQQNRASRFLPHVLGAAAELERSLIRERTLAGQQRYRHDYAAGKVGKTVYSRSGKNLPPHRPRKIFNRDSVAVLRAQGLNIRAIADRLRVGSRNRRPDAAGACQKFVAAIWEQGAGLSAGTFPIFPFNRPNSAFGVMALRSDHCSLTPSCTTR
jgi:DNA invertase Pin-like site-specific DNA recombinase